jgi:hypothetical protein
MLAKFSMHRKGPIHGNERLSRMAGWPKTPPHPDRVAAPVASVAHNVT